MFRRFITLTAAIASVLVVAGLAQATDLGAKSKAAAQSAIDAQLELGEELVGKYDVAGAGSVEIGIDSAGLRLIEATPRAGWSVDIHQDSAAEIEVRFLKSQADALTMARFRAELRDGRFEVETDTETNAAVSPSNPDSSTTSSTVPDDEPSTTTTTEPSTTTTTEPTSTTTTVAGASGEVQVEAVVLALGPAGSAHLQVASDGSVEVGSVDAPGWQFEVDDAGDGEFEIELWNGVLRVEVKAEFHFTSMDGDAELIIELEVDVELDNSGHGDDGDDDSGDDH